MHQITTIANEALYAVPGSSQFSFLNGSACNASVISSAHPADNTYIVRVNTREPARLIVRITDINGWQVAADGKAIPIEHFANDFFSVDLPGGTHSVTLRYWPTTLTYGLILAVCGLTAWAVVAEGRRRRSPTAT